MNRQGNKHFEAERKSSVCTPNSANHRRPILVVTEPPPCATTKSQKNPFGSKKPKLYHIKYLPALKAMRENVITLENQTSAAPQDRPIDSSIHATQQELTEATKPAPPCATTKSLENPFGAKKPKLYHIKYLPALKAMQEKAITFKAEKELETSVLPPELPNVATTVAKPINDYPSVIATQQGPITKSSCAPTKLQKHLRSSKKPTLFHQESSVTQ